MKQNIAIIIPVLNSMRHLPQLLPQLRALSPAPDRVLFIDSSSDDGTPDEIRKAGYEVHTIRREDFGHGKTRNMGAEMCKDADILVFMTDDAIPTSPDMLSQLTKPFEDEKIALTFARQLPKEDATPSAQFARLFNYPPQSRRNTAADIPSRGLKALFCSNSCAAYRRDAFEAVGRFPESLPLGEDMAITARLLEAGYATYYAAEAQVKHSHNYTAYDEFRRYFDIGALMRTDPWLISNPQKASGDGFKFVREEIKFIYGKNNLFELFSIGPRTAAKLIGYKLGQNFNKLPADFVKKVGMHRAYWNRVL
jgi:rhamnosyltransferase